MSSPGTPQLLHRLQQLSAANFWTKLLVLVGLGIPNVVLCAIIYKFASGNDWYTALFKAYGVLYRIPGVGITGEATTIAAVVLNAIFLFGVFVFAILLGTIADEVKNQLKSLRSGKKPVKVNDHILILNWNQKMIPLLRQISTAKTHHTNSMWSMPIVILADTDKAAMDTAITDGLKVHNLEIHTRCGSPMRIKNLVKVSATDASTIVLLHPEQASSDTAAHACQAATAVALSSMLHGKSTNVVVHAPEVFAGSQSNLSLLVKAGQTVGYDFHVLPLSERTFVERIMAHAALQPGVARVLLEILRQGADVAQFRFLEMEGPAQQYSQLRRRYRDAVLCGYLAADGAVVHLNPAEEVEVAAGDTLVLLARTGRPALPASGEPMPPTPQPLITTPRRPGAARRIVVASFHPDSLQNLADGFGQFAPSGTTVTFVTTSMPASLPAQCEACSYSVVVANQPTSCEALVQAGAGDADSVVLLGGPPGMTQFEQDACMVTAFLQVNEAVATGGRPSSMRPCHVVAGVHNSNTKELIQQLLGSFSLQLVTAELVQADEYVSAMLTQIAAEPKYGKLLEELTIKSEGNEIYLRERSGLGLGDKKGLVKWAEIADIARARQQTALGFVGRDGAVVLAPRAEEAWAVDELDKVVVMAEDF